MQATLFQLNTSDIDDILWIRAARKECLQYGEHGIDTEIQDGKEICFNCGGRL